MPTGTKPSTTTRPTARALLTFCRCRASTARSNCGTTLRLRGGRLAWIRRRSRLCKCPDTFAPIGPHIMTADEVPDVNTAGQEISTRVNGVYPQEFMHPGDEVTVGVSGVGYLTNPLVAGWAEGSQ